MSAPVQRRAPPLVRRLVCMVYEGVLLFGVVTLVGLLFAGFTQQRHALQGQWGLRAVLLIVLAVYFVGFWSRRGQTLAMKTWHIGLRDLAGSLPSPARAGARFVMSWLWFVPALALAWLAQLKSGAEIGAVVVAGWLTYAALARLHPSRQFLHDVVCGTQLVDMRPTPHPPVDTPPTPSSAPTQPTGTPP